MKLRSQEEVRCAQQVFGGRESRLPHKTEVRGQANWGRCRLRKRQPKLIYRSHRGDEIAVTSAHGELYLRRNWEAPSIHAPCDIAGFRAVICIVAQAD